MIRMSLRAVAAAFVFASLVPVAAHAQSPCTPAGDHGQSVAGKPLASPAASADTMLNGKTVSISYNAPSVRCRTIFGGLVPYDHWWRTGANPATTLKTETALKLGALTVPAGTYTLYSLPEDGKPWMLIVNKQTGQWGTVYNADQDLGRTPMSGKMLTASQEVMSISFEDVHGKHAQLHIRWDKSDEWVNVEAL